MLTIGDIRNPTRASGFNRVTVGPQSPPRYKARAGHSGAGRKTGWRGRFHATPAEAAQEYCDYINSGQAKPAAKLNTAGHKGHRAPIERDDEVEAALGLLRDVKAQKEGVQGYVYLIGVEGDDWGVKVGYSVNAEARVRELQTGSPRILYLLAKFRGTTADERELHERYLCDNLVGEWFRPSIELLHEFDVTEHDYASTLGIYERLTA